MLVGLTGGIAAGKTVVAGELRKLGASVIDADQVAREVTVPGSECFGEILKVFGVDFVLADGTLDRRRIGEAVFSDPEKLRKLNEITHPRIRAVIMERIEELSRTRPDGIIVIDAPLLIETGLYRKMDKVVVVSATDDTQIERLSARDGISAADAVKRIAVQLPVKRKLEFADFIIEGDGTMEETIEATKNVYDCLSEAAGSGEGVR